MTLAPTYVISQELNITGLNKGEEAPFTGILLTKAALAKIEADLRLEVQLCENNCKLKNNNSWFVPVVAIASFIVGVATTVGITYAVNK